MINNVIGTNKQIDRSELSSKQRSEQTNQTEHSGLNDAIKPEDERAKKKNKRTKHTQSENSEQSSQTTDEYQTAVYDEHGKKRSTIHIDIKV